MAEVTMSLAEYEDLVAQAGRVRKHEGSPAHKALVKRVGKKDPKMARALKKANSMGRKKNGSLKKGWSQAKIMKKAHALKKRMR